MVLVDHHMRPPIKMTWRCLLGISRSSHEAADPDDVEVGHHRLLWIEAPHRQRPTPIPAYFNAVPPTDVIIAMASIDAERWSIAIDA